MRSDRYNTIEVKEDIKEEPVSKKKKIKNKDKVKNKEKEIREKDTSKGFGFFKKFFLFIFIVIGLIFSYAYFIEPHLLKVNEYKYVNNTLPDSFHGIKIVSFGDINYGSSIKEKDLDKIINKINDLKPDIIFFTGDLLNKNISLNDKEQSLLVKYLSKLNPSINKFAVYGDDNEKIYTDIMNKSGFKLLNNEVSFIYYKDIQPIMVVGFNDKKSNPDYSIINNDEVNFKIVLVHNPNSIDSIVTYNPNIIMAGHNLNGTVNIPKVNKLFLDNNTDYYKGYYHKNNTDIYITNGLGTGNIPIRINNIPSVSLFRLYKY